MRVWVGLGDGDDVSWRGEGLNKCLVSYMEVGSIQSAVGLMRVDESHVVRCTCSCSNHHV